jgi:molybdenum cofactor cytidylyltransferase
MSSVVRGVILAAGASSRMGRPKAALALTDAADTFVGRLARTFLLAGLPDIVIVTGAHEHEVRRATVPCDARVRFVHNADWGQGQLSSLLAALDAPPRFEHRVDVEAIVMTLVDIPTVSAATVAQVLREWRASGAPIVRPARGDEHGHPVVFDRSIFDELRRADPARGAKPVVHAHLAAIRHVPIADAGAYLDVDTEADYEALRARLAGVSGAESVERA